MAEKLEKTKKSRAAIRASVTKLINNIETNLKEEDIDSDLIEETTNLLDAKAEQLKNLDNEIGSKVNIDIYDAEINLALEYQDKIALTIFRARKKLKQNKSSDTVNENASQSLTLSDHSQVNKFVKLPKLNIQKFYGDSIQYMNFWNTFKVAIHDNESLSKIEKFNYLKSCLGGNAASAVEGFTISEENYDSALNILEKRFGRKDVIINSHMERLLNLTPVHKANDIPKLKRLHDTIEMNVRSLTSLGIETQSYSNMLVAIILKNLPGELRLEYNRKYIDNPIQPDVNVLLAFLQSEIQSRERSFAYMSQQPLASVYHHSVRRDSLPPHGEARKVAPSKATAPSTLEFMTAVDDAKTCVFCGDKAHETICTAFTADEKRKFLKTAGRCFSCLRKNHIMRKCRTQLTCTFCKKKHNKEICFNSNIPSSQPSEKRNIFEKYSETKKAKEIFILF